MCRKSPALLAIIVAILLPFAAIAQTTIHGSLSGTLGPGTYIVDGDCEVLTGQILTISPGTTFLHTDHHTWNIYGVLTAVGTQSSPIIFTHQNPSMLNKWGGIRFNQGAPTTSVMEWCQFLWSRNVGSPYSDGGAIYSNRVMITLRHCIVNNCHASSGGGIYLNGASNSIIDSCTVTNNFANNGGGIQLNGCSGVLIRNCTIGNNAATST